MPAVKLMVNKTREERILAMIKDCEENPYKFSVKQLCKKFRIVSGEIQRLAENLNLEVKGHMAENKRREIITEIQNNPMATVEEIAGKDYSRRTVYRVAEKMGHIFQTETTLRKLRMAGKTIKEAQTIKDLYNYF